MKTIEEMLAYAKNIVDNDENAIVVFLFRDWQQYVEHIAPEMNNPSKVYKSKGVMSFGTISEGCKASVSSRWMGTNISHLFITDVVKWDVYGLLRNRVRNRNMSYEPVGIYTKFYVERWESY